MKKLILIIVVFLVSCEYLQNAKKEDQEGTIIASVGENHLYQSDLDNIIPEDLAKEDSIVLAKSFINTWAKEQLLLQKAQENLSEVKGDEIDELVDKYRQSLYINNFKEKLIKKELDTTVRQFELIKYYNASKENFKLNEELLKIKYVAFGVDFLDKEEVIEKFKSDNEEDLEALENLTINFKDYVLRDSLWISYNDFLEKIPILKGESKRNLLKKSKLIQKEDSLGVYLVAVNEVLKRNDIAPLSYVRGNIKQLILHKRKLELIREIEKTLINDAIKNDNFKEY